MRDQLIDTFAGILAALVGRNQLAVESSNASGGIAEVPPNLGVLGLEMAVRFGQGGDGSLQSVEAILEASVVEFAIPRFRPSPLPGVGWFRRCGRSRFRGCVGNERPPVFEVERTEEFWNPSSGLRRQI